MANEATELPPYHALLVVDVKDFSGLPGRDHADVTGAIPVILHSAFQRSGLLDVWRERRFEATTGDGYAVGFASAVLPLLLSKFLPALQDELEYRDQVDASPAALRMRVSVNVGPMTHSGDGSISEGSGAARVENHRLLDAQPVRDLLARSGPATRVAAIVSARAFQDAVLTGYAGDSPELYVKAPVQVKDFVDEAYLRVPVPTGDLLHSGFVPDAAAAKVEQTHDSGQVSNSVVGDVSGNLLQARDIGHHGDSTTWNVHGSSNINAGSGNQFNGDDVKYYDRRQQ